MPMYKKECPHERTTHDTWIDDPTGMETGGSTVGKTNSSITKGLEQGWVALQNGKSQWY